MQASESPDATAPNSDSGDTQHQAELVPDRVKDGGVESINPKPSEAKVEINQIVTEVIISGHFYHCNY